MRNRLSEFHLLTILFLYTDAVLAGIFYYGYDFQALHLLTEINFWTMMFLVFIPEDLMGKLGKMLFLTGFGYCVGMALVNVGRRLFDLPMMPR